MKRYRIIISGGGTGGHIFPALSIADAVRSLSPESEILFVGAQGKMEMQKVPQAGYRIEGLPVAGLQRKLNISNLKLPFKILKSLSLAGRIIDSFKPDIAVGVGGYASAPLLWKAAAKGIPCLIQEQNSYAGLTNRILGKKAALICTAYEKMERFFPEDKILLTGNPIRKGITPPTAQERSQAILHFGLDPDKKTIAVVGGSLGCGTFNRIMKKFTTEGKESDFQILWQSGGAGSAITEEFFKNLPGSIIRDGFRRYGNVINTDFISRMDLAFAAADLMVSRAGAGTISELCVVGKPTIFVPSPIVAEDHQTHNAKALVTKNAALMVSDSDADAKLMDLMEKTIHNPSLLDSLSKNILPLARPEAARTIAEKIFEIIEK
ncbi:MAG: undecaprenyldiphospho-muramoylpentapeptide beta-N-acetylglucosaminyltransferase [Alistipes sp.]|nr:undecaprenyldiphospho-muramoylpentapeptide beta-N-acetylglucosaminyltransferase [Candidatus Minthomonas equi]